MFGIRLELVCNEGFVMLGTNIIKKKEINVVYI